MSPRRSLRLPILLAVVMTVQLAVLTVGWVLLSVFGAPDREYAGLKWALFAVGTGFLAMLVVGVALYLVLTIKAIDLSRRQSNFIDSVTHELKSPISSMKLYLQTLTRRKVDPEQQAQFHESILEDVDRLDRLVDRILDAGRLEGAADAEAARVDVAVDDVIRECAASTRARHRVPEEAIRLDLEPAVVRGHRPHLELLFRNVVDNAVKYGGEPPRVEVVLRVEERRRVRVTVADNGAGIPRRYRKRVFVRFVRLGSELTRKKPGTGLGLYISKTIARRMKGAIRVRDRVPGPGSVFEIVLPGAPARAPEGATAP